MQNSYSGVCMEHAIVMCLLIGIDVNETRSRNSASCDSPLLATRVVNA